VKDGRIAFSIIDLLKGRSHGSLLLTSGMLEVLKPGNECVLCWTGRASGKSTVSETLLNGDPEWICMPVSTEGGKATVSGVGSLEQVKAICASR
jgi:hypothetical protein